MEEHISNLENIQDNMLNKLKSNIVNWYNFTKLDSILLLGDIDICVAEYFCNKFEKVVIVTKSINKLSELSKLSDKTKIFDNISNIKNNKFDYIFMIDYLNYQNTNEILSEELIQIEALLNEDGKILMTLKNCLGAMEIVNRTYRGLSKQRINQIIEASNLKYFKFYYILPEIEQVNVIFSDEFLPTLNDLRRNNHFSKEETPNGRLENELFVKVLEKENSDFKTIANAFFVEISKNEIDNKIKAVFYNNIRPEEFRLKTTIFEDYAIKEIVCEENLKHLNNIKKNIDILKQCEINSLDEYDDTKIKSRILKNAQRLDDKFIELFKNDEESALNLIDKFKNEVLMKLGKVENENTVFDKYEITNTENDLVFVKHGFWDLTFQNVFIENDKLFVYDQEWYEENIPLDYIIYRSILILDALNVDEKEYLYKRLKLVKYRDIFDELERMIQKDLTNEPMRCLFANTLGAEKQVEIKNEEIQIAENKKQMPVCLKECKVIKGIIKISGRFTLKLFRKTSKFLYDRIPKKLKRKIKQKIEYSNKLSKITGIPMAMSYNLQTMKLYDKKTKIRDEVYSQITLNKSIGVYLYLNSEEIMQEFYNYLSNIPYEFDLYIAINKDLNSDKINSFFRKIINLNEIEVSKLENAMIISFFEKMKKYDYIMYISSERNLMSGINQTEFRKYLLDNLFGSTERIMKCFYLMEEKQVGLVYPDSYSTIPYWVYNWTDDIELAKEICKKLGIKYENKFLEFPIGNVFFVKREVLEPLFNLELDNSNEIENVLIKILGIVTRNQNYNIAIYNEGKGEFLLNQGIKNLDKYYLQNVDVNTEYLMQFDTITFNVFDTLITRKLYDSDDIFKILDKKVEVNNYYELRKKAEDNVKNKKDYTINDIYEEFSAISNVSADVADKTKQMEIQLELEICIPRKDALEVYNNLLKENKKIVLISDTYLPKEDLNKILNNCGYYNYSELLISSEIEKRNDKGLYYISGKNLYEQSDYYFECEKNIDESIILGHILNKVLFNSPFALYDYENNAIINDEYKYGYSIIGPIIFEYFKDLIKSLINRKENDILVFPAREGYYLYKIYNYLVEKLNIEELKNIENYYLYISKRAITVASIENKDDIYEIMNEPFKGTVKELFYNKLGFKEKSLGDNQIELPRDFELVKNVIDLRFNEIMEVVKCEKANYLEYINTLITNISEKEINFISLGNNKIISKCLSKILNQIIIEKSFNIEKNYDYKKNENLNLLEAFFTAPQGNLQYFEKDENGLKPIFDYDDNSEKVRYLEKVYDAVIEYINDMLNVFDNKILDIEFNKNILVDMYKNCIEEYGKLNNHMKKFLK